VPRDIFHRAPSIHLSVTSFFYSSSFFLFTLSAGAIIYAFLHFFQPFRSHEKKKSVNWSHIFFLLNYKVHQLEMHMEKNCLSELDIKMFSPRASKKRSKLNFIYIFPLRIYFFRISHTATGAEMLLWEESIHNWKSDIIWSEEQGKRIEAKAERSGYVIL
jgi:hypothetical protein